MEDKKVIWITGASSGIGRSLAIKFAKEGWIVAASARRENLLKELHNENENIYSYPLDVTDIEQCKNVFKNIVEKFRNIESLKYFSAKNIFLIFFILSLPVYGLVYDWGRVIHINYNFFVILLLFYFKLNLIDLNYLNTKLKKINHKSKISILIFICFIFSPDILSINPLEYFPLPSQFVRFSGGIIEKTIELY